MKNLFSNFKEKESTLLGVGIIAASFYLLMTKAIDTVAFVSLLSTGAAMMGLSFKNQAK